VGGGNRAPAASSRLPDQRLLQNGLVRLANSLALSGGAQSLSLNAFLWVADGGRSSGTAPLGQQGNSPENPGRVGGGPAPSFPLFEGCFGGDVVATCIFSLDRQDPREGEGGREGGG